MTRKSPRVWVTAALPLGFLTCPWPRASESPPRASGIAPTPRGPGALSVGSGTRDALGPGFRAGLPALPHVFPTVAPKARPSATTPPAPRAAGHARPPPAAPPSPRAPGAGPRAHRKRRGLSRRAGGLIGPSGPDARSRYKCGAAAICATVCRESPRFPASTVLGRNPALDHPPPAGRPEPALRHLLTAPSDRPKAPAAAPAPPPPAAAASPQPPP